jgi:hypothetical protein
MRPAAFILSAIVLLAAAIAQHGPMRSTQATSSHQLITDCALQGAAVQGACSPVSLDSTPATIVSHRVYTGACPGSDLHVVHYASAGNGEYPPRTARWCA